MQCWRQQVEGREASAQRHSRWARPHEAATGKRPFIGTSTATYLSDPEDDPRRSATTGDGSAGVDSWQVLAMIPMTGGRAPRTSNAS
jgi:hypothetical protein